MIHSAGGEGDGIQSRCRVAGFSLTEAMVTLAILSILMGAILTVFRQSQASYKAQILQTERIQQMRIAMDQIIRVLRQAGNDPHEVLSGPPVVRLDGGMIEVRSDITGSVPSISGKPQDSTGDPDGSLSSIYELVTFQYDPQGKYIFGDVGYGPEVLAEGITLLNFTFYDIHGNVVTDPALICKVRVLMVGEAKHPDMQTKEVATVTIESEVLIRSKQPQVFPE